MELFCICCLLKSSSPPAVLGALIISILERILGGSERCRNLSKPHSQDGRTWTGSQPALISESVRFSC